MLTRRSVIKRPCLSWSRIASSPIDYRELNYADHCRKRKRREIRRSVFRFLSRAPGLRRFCAIWELNTGGPCVFAPDPRPCILSKEPPHSPSMPQAGCGRNLSVHYKAAEGPAHLKSADRSIAGTLKHRASPARLLEIRPELCWDCPSYRAAVQLFPLASWNLKMMAD